MLFKYRGELMLLLVAILWGAGFIWVDNALRANIGPYTIIALRGLIPGLILLPFVFKNKFYKNKRDFLFSILLGISTFAGFAFQTIGQQMTTSANSAFYTCLYVIITPFFAFFFTRRKLESKNVFTSLLMIFGIFFMTFLPSIIKGESASFSLGDILLILCAISFTFQILLITVTLKKADGFSSISMMLLILGIGGLIGMLINHESFIIENTDKFLVVKGYFNVFLAGIISSLVCYFIQFIANKLVSPTKTSIILAMETPFGFLFSFIFLHENLNMYHLIGLLFVLTGIIITNIDFRRIDISKYKILLLDLDNTILDFDKAEVKAYFDTFKEFNIKTSYKMFNDFKKINTNLWKMYEKGLYKKDLLFVDRFKELFKKYHLADIDFPLFSKRYLENLGSHAYFMPFVKKTLKRLALNHDLYLITNGQIDVQRSRIKLAELDNYFKGYYISEEIGWQKPTIEYFNFIKNELKYNDNEALVIGDSLTSDIKGANNANLDSCFISHYDVETDLNITYQVESLWQLK